MTVELTTTQKEKARLIAMLIAVQTGIMNPSKVIGTGYKNPKACAIEYLNAEIKSLS